MFCPKCGKENQSGYTFCMYCGGALVDNQNFGAANGPQEYSGRLRDTGYKAKAALKKARFFLRQHRKAAIPVGIVAAVILLIAVIGCSVFSPKRDAIRYFKAVVEGDAKLAYSCIDMPRSEFTGRQAFAAFWEETYPKKDVFNYEIKELTDDYAADSGKNAITHDFVIHYFLSGESNEYSMQVTVVESRQRRLLLFPNYKVMPTFLVTNYEIAVPAGATATLNGTQLTDPVPGEYSDVYTVPSLFTEEYELQIDSELCGHTVLTVYPQHNGWFDYDSIPYSEETVAGMYSLATNQLKTLVAAAISNAEFPETIACDADGVVRERFREMQERMCNPAEGTGYQAFTIFETSDMSYGQWLSSYANEYSCSINFGYSYNVVNKDGRDELYSNEGESQGNATLYYEYRNGAWVLCDIYTSF